jgi:hypothetical protein
MRMKGKRTAKRKAKRRNYKHRPDKSFTEKRKAALQNSKSDKIDSFHIPDESFNDADDEGED